MVRLGKPVSDILTVKNRAGGSRSKAIAVRISPVEEIVNSLTKRYGSLTDKQYKQHTYLAKNRTLILVKLLGPQEENAESGVWSASGLQMLKRVRVGQI